MFSLPLTLLALVAGVFAAGDEGSPADYQPNTNQQCPNITETPLVRVFTPASQSLHPREEAYVNTRLSQAIPDEWRNWIGDGSGIGYNLDAFSNNFTKIGLAISGGGYRAAQYGAGVISALDARNDSAKAAGTGGLLQVSSYLTGLSGGSWVTGSLFFNDWPRIEDLVFGNNGNLSGWILDLNLAIPGGENLANDNNQYFFGSVLWSVVAKAQKGIDTSLTDSWGRMIAYHFLNETTRDNFFTNDTAHGAGQLWSRIPETAPWQQHLEPFPIIMADSRPVGSNLTTVLSPEPIVYEITPMEFGSWDPNLSAMTNITYIGTHFNDSQPLNDTACVTGFDEASFMMGTSASLFNVMNYFLGISPRYSYPFQGIKPGAFEDSNSSWIELIDGSSNLENVPLGPLFVKSRELDVIVGIDCTGDDLVNGWPNGTSPLASQSRIKTLLGSSHQPFPPLPGSSAEFIETGVNARPSFFGCNPQQNPPEYPMFIYLPNAPPINGDDPVTNTGTFKIEYTQKHTRLFIDQCAAIDRARYRASPIINRSDFCTTCFQQYCYDPNNKTSKNALVNRKLVFKDPDPQGVSKVEHFLSAAKVPLILGFLGFFAALAAVIGYLYAFASRFIVDDILMIYVISVWRKRRIVRAQQYKLVSDLHDDEVPFTQFKRYSGHTPGASTTTFESSELYDLPYVPERQGRHGEPQPLRSAGLDSEHSDR
ncbi:hypothetical protein EWM64_g1831 [Hericium alpestre]|uniref:Lysophospholipase n=1 Tax=Hericium alpestre TaxID=135208 RepID=A0A4Z0A6S4_9AGAM|nr:hypothetical protein EWM64_g1831 [Hericium alpestre]